MQLYAVTSYAVEKVLETVDYPYRLYSYQYLSQELVGKITARDPRMTIMDSGVFSFMTGVRKMENSLDAYKAYTEKYISDLNRWGYKGWLIECDAQRILGTEKSMQLRALFEPLKQRTIYVWHIIDGVEAIEQMALEHSYIAFSFPEFRARLGNSKSIALTNDLLFRIHEVCKRAKKKPPRVHILGGVSPKMIQTSRAVSCDSATWTSGPRFGHITVWSADRGLFLVDINSAYFEKLKDGVLEQYPSLADKARGDYDIVNTVAALSFKRYQMWLDAHISPAETRI